MRMYYKLAAAAVVVVDVTSPDYLLQAVKWKREIQTYTSSRIPVLLIATKADLLLSTDLVERGLKDFSSQHGFVGCFLTSAKENCDNKNTTSEAVFGLLASTVLESVPRPTPPSSPPPPLSRPPLEQMTIEESPSCGKDLPNIFLQKIRKFGDFFRNIRKT